MYTCSMNSSFRLSIVAFALAFLALFSSTFAVTREEGVITRDAFIDSLIALQKAAVLAQPPSGQGAFVMPAAQEKEMLLLIEKGLALSTKVTDAFLDWAHPQLKNQYRVNLISGTRTYHEGLKAQDPAKQAEGIRLQSKWGEWWTANAGAVDNRLNGR
jgi:hypothetical protein